MTRHTAALMSGGGLTMQDGLGLLDFKEAALAVAFLSPAIDRVSTAKLCFVLFSEDGASANPRPNPNQTRTQTQMLRLLGAHLVTTS